MRQQRRNSLLYLELPVYLCMQVTDIIMCGHYGCGSVKAAMENKDHGLLEHWLRTIRSVQRLHQAELSTIQDAEQRHQRLVELNVQEACMNLFANPIVQKKQALDPQPRILAGCMTLALGCSRM
jgi:carbonic anhydrase